MTAKMTAAGLDPSRIQERAEILAKAQGAERKRKRDDADSAMDVDAEGEGDEGDWMDVDAEGGDRTPKKRRKANSGAGVVAKGKHTPATNRQLAGMRDATVRPSLVWCFVLLLMIFVQQASKAIQLRNLAQREPNRQAKAGESDRAIKTKMVCRSSHFAFPSTC
jgi:nucleolar GTP-binding protein